MEREVREILFRYLVGMAVAILVLFIPLFYFIFRPPTIWPTIWILNIFYDLVSTNLSSITIGNITIKFIDACIAGSAYSLLFILNILTFGLTLKKRIFIFIFDAFLLLILNILRLLILIVLLISKPTIFDITHNIFWYGINTIYVIFIWVLTISIFKIRSIPFVSDVKFILDRTKRRKEK